MMRVSFDLVVLGGGPGGYVAAIRAAQLGMKSAVVEREHLGGICLNWGCIPTKVLLRSADLSRQIRHASDLGLKSSVAGFDLDVLVERSCSVSGHLRDGIKHLLRKNEVTVYEGNGALAGPGRVRIFNGGKTARELSANHILIATGARPKTIPGIEADGAMIWTYKHAIMPSRIPKSLLVVGAGAIGMELASFYREFGAEVTIVEVFDRILPAADEEISALAGKSLEAQGLRIITGGTLQALKRGVDDVTVTISENKGTFEVTVDQVILAVGVVGNVEGLGIEGTRVRVENSQVVVDGWLRTGEPGVYAVGDVAGPPWLAHKATREGVICVEKIAGNEAVRPLDKARIPNCVYGFPQVASIGLTEQAARERGYRVRVGRFPFSGNGKAIALGHGPGLVKTVFDAQTGTLLGAHMIGPEVAELIHGFSVAMALETTEVELTEAVYPHPTLSEMISESVLEAYGRAIHI